MPSLVEICQVVLEKKIFFNLSMYFCNFVIISPFQKSWILHLNKFEFPFPKDALWQAWLKLAQWFCRRRFFKFVNVILQVRNYLPVEKRKWTFVWTNLNPLRPRMLCAKFGWNWPSGSWEAIQISIFFLQMWRPEMLNHTNNMQMYKQLYLILKEQYIFKTNCLHI